MYPPLCLSLSLYIYMYVCIYIYIYMCTCVECIQLYHSILYSIICVMCVYIYIYIYSKRSLRARRRHGIVVAISSSY